MEARKKTRLNKKVVKGNVPAKVVFDLSATLCELIIKDFGFVSYSNDNSSKEFYINQVATIIDYIKWRKTNYRQEPKILKSCMIIKPYVKALLTHDNQNHVKLAKFVRNEVRNKKKYKEV